MDMDDGGSVDILIWMISDEGALNLVPESQFGHFYHDHTYVIL